ncbi:hypothetical protein [Bordetella petrii]|uniref:hypothetical protein n=1 Tax=Bordetella petrii TaxID=94624 RepID=UPI001E35A5AF|nr:hypothetical protein [Bordetella petrii]MCD0503465.1 hypothetical protein [Bordetella petrii]
MNRNDATPPDPDALGLGVGELMSLARSAGLESADESALQAFALAVAEQCAEIGDQYTTAKGNCGEAIRTHFGLG